MSYIKVKFKKYTPKYKRVRVSGKWKLYKAWTRARHIFSRNFLEKFSFYIAIEDVSTFLLIISFASAD